MLSLGVISLETDMWSGLVLARPGFRILTKYITKVKITIRTSLIVAEDERSQQRRKMVCYVRN